MRAITKLVLFVDLKMRRRAQSGSGNGRRDGDGGVNDENELGNSLWPQLKMLIMCYECLNNGKVSI